MRRISSRQTYFLKRVFPWLMIGFIVVMEGAMVMALVAEGAAENLALLVCVAVVIPLVTLASLWVAMWLLVFGLIDEVWDVGDGLLVRNQGMEFEIAWTDIMSVDYCG